MKVRAKVKCHNAPEEGKPGYVHFHPVYGEGNEGWAASTPSGQVSLFITNLEALKLFKEGKEYYVEFSEVV